MAEMFFQCAFAVLAVLGTVEVCRAALAGALRKSCPARHYLVLRFTGRDEQTEQRLLSAYLRAKWVGFGAEVICIDCGMDPETRCICELFCADHAGISICTPEEFGKLCAV